MLLKVLILINEESRVKDLLLLMNTNKLIELFYAYAEHPRNYPITDIEVTDESWCNCIRIQLWYVEDNDSDWEIGFAYVPYEEPELINILSTLHTDMNECGHVKYHHAEG